MKQPVGISCIFSAEVFNRSDEVTFSTGEFSNMVLSNGLLKLYDYSLAAMTKFVNIGSSLVLPDITQTGLLDHKFSANTVFNSQEGAYYSYWPVYRGYKRVIQFAVGTCTGDFYEIGLSRLSNSDYFNRQRFKNSDGDDILVRVKSDEGLRITCDLRIYPPSDSIIYSQVYSLSLNGATAGDITFSNGVSTKTLTYAQLIAPDTAKLELENFLGIGSLTNYVLVGSEYFILAHPLNTQSLNLSITSHTLTGGAGDPILTTVQEYTSTAFSNDVSFVDGLIDQTLTETMVSNWVTYVANMNHLSMRLSTASGTQYFGWGHIYNNDLTTIALKNLFPRLMKSDGTFVNASLLQTTKEPAIGDYKFTKRCYYSPAKFGSGNQNIAALSWCYDGNYSNPNLTIEKFDEPLVLTDQEEIEFSASFSWGAK